MEAISIKCPNCGASLGATSEVCDYCNSPVVIKSFKSVRTMPMPQVNKYVRSFTEQANEQNKLSFSLALCQLRLKLYDMALSNFEKAMEEDYTNAHAYYYAVVSMLKGEKAFLLSKQNADQCLEYLNAAIEIDPDPLFYYLSAYIRLDFYKRKFFNIKPSYEDMLEQAEDLSDDEIEEMFELLGVERPEAM